MGQIFVKLKILRDDFSFLNQYAIQQGVHAAEGFRRAIEVFKVINDMKNNGWSFVAEKDGHKHEIIWSW